MVTGNGAGDDDLLAPVGPLATDREDVDTTDALPGDGGTGDGAGIVRLWVDDGRLSKVRVSPVWHVKLGRDSLENCFARALALASMRVAEPAPAEDPTWDHLDFSRLPRFGRSALEIFQSRFDALHKRWGQVMERQQERKPEQPAVNRARSEGVTVSLDGTGCVAGVSFDERWLETAQAGTICTHVMRASDKAHEGFAPVGQDRTEAARIKAEHHLLLTAFEAMLDPKERSVTRPPRTTNSPRTPQEVLHDRR